MLTLGAKAGERILIGDNIVLEVYEIRGSAVRLSFVAPKEVVILRESVAEAIKEQNK
jgi:carbon storage regulator